MLTLSWFRWRNTVGLGIFIFVSDVRDICRAMLTLLRKAKDCLNILHVYLTKREIETRRIKSRSFAGIDLRELDLVHPARF